MVRWVNIVFVDRYKRVSFVIDQVFVSGVKKNVK